MDEKLIQRLRSLVGMIPQKHKLPSGADTVICSLEAFMQIKELAKEAADAIEDMQEDNAALNGTVSNLIGQIAELSKSNWIPVTERLPQEDCHVLAYYGFDRGDGYLGMMFMQVLDYYARDPSPHYQHEGLNGMKVTHWMPLPPAPEPPKEEV